MTQEQKLLYAKLISQATSDDTRLLCIDLLLSMDNVPQEEPKQQTVEHTRKPLAPKFHPTLYRKPWRSDISKGVFLDIIRTAVNLKTSHPSKVIADFQARGVPVPPSIITRDFMKTYATHILYMIQASQDDRTRHMIKLQKLTESRPEKSN